MNSKNCVNCNQEFFQRTGERDKRFSSRKYCSLYGSGDNTAEEFFEYYLCTKRDI